MNAEGFDENEDLKIYLDLDGILDTRLGTLYVHYGESVVQKLLQNDLTRYTERVLDKFVNIHPASFQEKYQQRNVDVLQNSPRTGLLPVISKDYDTYLQRSFMMNRRRAKLQVNYYPYQDLTPDDLATLEEAIQNFFLTTIDLEWVYMPVEELTVPYVAQNFTHLYMYHPGPFLDTHHEALTSRKLSQVSLIRPNLFFERKPSKDEVDFCRQVNMSPHQLLEIGSAPYIRIIGCSASVFSIQL